MFSKKTVPVEMEVDGGIVEFDAKPGTPEFAAGVKQMVDRALSEVSQKIGKENWDKYCTLMFACNYDKGEGMAQCIDGNTDQLLILMGITIHTMAEQRVNRSKLTGKKQANGNAVIGELMQQLMAYVNVLDHDGQDSGIIT